MKSRPFCACALLIATISCRISASELGSPEQHSAKEIGINAVISTAFLGGIQTRIREGKLREARELIDAEYLRLLPLLREFDVEIMSEPIYRRLRDRTVRSLQTRWLKHQPMYLDAESSEYLERTCATIPGCPKGRVHPLRQPTLPPPE